MDENTGRNRSCCCPCRLDRRFPQTASRVQARFASRRGVLRACSRSTLLVFGSLVRPPSQECGGCLLTKFALAQFTAWLFWRLGNLFWRLGNQRHLAFNIFDTLSPHTVAGGYTRPIHTPHKTLPLSTRVTQQSRGPMSKTGGFALAAQTTATSSGLSGPIMRSGPPSVRPPQSYTRASRLGTS